MTTIGTAGFGCLENYITDLSVTVMVGLGYYLFKGMKRRNDDFADPERGLKNLKGKLEGALQRWQYAKSIEDYNELLKSDYNSDNIEDPFSIINLMNKNGVLPNIDTYNALLLNSYSKNNEQYAELLKDEILDPCGPVTPNNFTLNVLIKGLNLKYKNLNIKNKNICSNSLQEIYHNFDRELINLLKTLEDRNIYMDLIGQNTILDSLVDQGRLNEAWNQYTCMKKRFKPDMYTLTTILRGIKKTSELSSDWLDKAFLILNEATTLDKEIDETFLNSLLDSCVKFNRVDKAENLFNEYKSQKKNLTEHSYCIMIKAYSKIYQLEKAEKMFNEIKKISKENNTQINVITYGAILNAFTRCKQIEKAEDILKEMEDKNIEINSHIYSTIINGYRISRKYEKALLRFEKIFTHIKTLNLDTIKKEESLNIIFYNSILDCCVESNKIEKMTEIFEFMKENQNHENFAKIDIITYSIIIKGFAKSNQIEKVTETYSYLKTRKDFKLDEMLYNTMIDCYAKHNDEKNALKIYNDMKTLNFGIGVITYGVLIKLYSNLGNCNKAFELFDECVKSEIKPSIVIYQILIKLQIKSKFIDRAITLFRNMIINQVKADQQIYELIIKGCMDQSREREAGEFILNALNEEIKVENYIFSNFVQKIDGAENNFKIFEKAEFVPKLIETVTTKSLNIELFSLNILRKIDEKLNGKKAYVTPVTYTYVSNRNATHSTFKEEDSSDEENGPSIYSVSATCSNKSKYFDENKKENNLHHSNSYNQKNSNKVSDFKGYYKTFHTYSEKENNLNEKKSNYIFENKKEENSYKFNTNVEKNDSMTRPKSLNSYHYETDYSSNTVNNNCSIATNDYNNNRSKYSNKSYFNKNDNRNNYNNQENGFNSYGKKKYNNNFEEDDDDSNFSDDKSIYG